jgi:2-deoxy-D-gluconate 3-dehydrogenase
MDLFDLTNKKAVVTGAGKETGLNFAIAKALNEKGAKIVIIDFDEARLQNTLNIAGGTEAGFWGIIADLSKRGEIERSFNESISLLGGIDILVNGAGIQYRCSAIDYPIDKWEQIMNLNLTTMLILSQLVGRIMLEQKHGKIINIASVNAFFGAKNMPAYACSKGGVVQLTKALSNEWIAQGVNVNALVPGFMSTEINEDLRSSEYGRDITTRIPINRWGTPKDLMGAAIFLASAASDYVSGIALPVDGGFMANS